MKIHEYQAKAFLAQFGISVPKGAVVTTPADAKKIAAELGNNVVIKSQVYAGGRGKAGGIKMANTPEEAEKRARELLGRRLVTEQTTPEGVPVSKVLVEEAIDIRRELYLGIVIDGTRRLPVMMASEVGGMEIEETARLSPEKVLKSYIDPPTSFQPFQGRKLAYGMNLNPEEIQPVIELMGNLYQLFLTKDCSLAEINPLVITTEGKLLALDAKLNFDDSAMFRHQELKELYDWEQEHPIEARAAQLGVRDYIKLDGDIGCMVNGAGAAIAVIDLLAQMGGKAANFYDTGPTPVPEMIANGFRIIAGDPGVKVILVDIFAGMGRGEHYAQGIVDGYLQTKTKLPVVVRLAGTNVEEAKRVLAESGINYFEASGLHDVAQKAVEIAKGKRGGKS